MRERSPKPLGPGSLASGEKSLGSLRPPGSRMGHPTPWNHFLTAGPWLTRPSGSHRVLVLPLGSRPEGPFWMVPPTPPPLKRQNLEEPSAFLPPGSLSSPVGHAPPPHPSRPRPGRGPAGKKCHLDVGEGCVHPLRGRQWGGDTSWWGTMLENPPHPRSASWVLPCVLLFSSPSEGSGDGY